MRHQVILFSYIFLFFSFFSCTGKQHKSTDSLSDEQSTQAVQKIPHDMDAVVLDTTQLREEAKPVEEPKIKVESTNPIVKANLPKPIGGVKKVIKEKKEPSPLAAESQNESPSKRETEVETKVRKSPETVEPKNAPSIEKETPQLDISHEIWDQLLKKYVGASGKVNYKGFKSDKAKLQSYLDHLNSSPPQRDWSRNKIVAYWINAYNAFTVKTIIDNYPLKSIMDLGKPWDKSFINIGEKTYSLNDIEHKILRAKYFDSRIHFAVNCASYSCPKILNQAFTESKVSSQMHALTIAYINDPRHNKISPNKAELSQLFEWYKDDFTKKGSLIEYINKYSKTKLNPDAKISFFPYNWSLNE